MPTAVLFVHPSSSLRLHQVAAASLLATLHFGALAQAPAPAAGASAPEVGKLQTVTVTAERRTENVQDVPSSITTLSGEILDVLNTSGQDLRLFSGRVPSLNIESSFGRAFPRFYIRGYGNTDFRLNASQPVSLVYDDIVQENPILKGFPAFDLDRVEVLRGPQGSLFGRNTPAGVVKFESVRPGKTFGGYGSLSVGSFEDGQCRGRAERAHGQRRCLPDLGTQPVARRLGQEHPAQRADHRPRGLPRFRAAPPIPVATPQGFQRAGQRACPRLRRLGPAVPRQHHPARHERTS